MSSHEEPLGPDKLQCFLIKTLYGKKTLVCFPQNVLDFLYPSVPLPSALGSCLTVRNFIDMGAVFSTPVFRMRCFPKGRLLRSHEIQLSDGVRGLFAYWELCVLSVYPSRFCR